MLFYFPVFLRRNNIMIYNCILWWILSRKINILLLNTTRRDTYTRVQTLRDLLLDFIKYLMYTLKANLEFYSGLSRNVFFDNPQNSISLFILVFSCEFFFSWHNDSLKISLDINKVFIMQLECYLTLSSIPFNDTLISA